MLVQQITPITIRKNFEQNKLNKTNITINSNSNNIQQNYPQIRYSDIPFGAIYNVKLPKKFNIEAEKNKLLKQIMEMLETNTKDTDLADMITSAFRNALGDIKQNLDRKIKILEQLNELLNNKTMNPHQKAEKAKMLDKEFKKLEKLKQTKPDSKNKLAKTQDERIDYQLMNKFKTALSEDNFNLRNVLKEYYSGLNNVKTIAQLNEQYPKIKTPPRPEEVIAQKLEKTLTKDFYQALDNVFETYNPTEISMFMGKSAYELIYPIAEKFKINPDTLFEKTGVPLAQTILKKYDHYKTTNTLSSIPEHRKLKSQQNITDTDIKLLSIDYDNFVISTIRQHYLDFMKFDDITYTQGNITISPGQLKNSDYKFEKMPDKVKGMLNLADSMHQAQRNYENFSPEEFKLRLDFYANREPGNNEEILGKIIDFDTCNFTEEDKKLLTKFLQELDKINDGEKSIEQALETIQSKGLEPKGTRKLNEIEKQQAELNYKIKQKKLQELNSVKKDFDDAINLLYQNNLNNLANSCAKYRPNTLDNTEIDNARFLINTIIKNIDSKNNKLNNPQKLEQSIARWDTFNSYKQNNNNTQTFKQALDFAKKDDGTINIDKAGQYLINSEIVEMYPNSLEATKYPEILEKIMDKTGSDFESAIKYLCKFDDYTELSNQDKTLLSKIINIFDSKDSVEKILLRHIVEKEYIPADTSVLTSIHENGNETIQATMASKAKQQILNKYKYPLCLDYLIKFEDALTSFATEKNSSGIKRTGRNNEAIKYKIELKIAGENDRLFSSNNDYYFDIFSDKGMH